MSIAIRICLIVVSVLVFIFMMRKIRKEKLLISDAVFWIIFSAGLLILSIFPKIIIYAADLLGFISPTNLVFMLIIFVLLLKMFAMSLHISHLDCQLRQTVQALAILEKRVRDQGDQTEQPEKSNRL